MASHLTPAANVPSARVLGGMTVKQVESSSALDPHRDFLFKNSTTDQTLQLSRQQYCPRLCKSKKCRQCPLQASHSPAWIDAEHSRSKSWVRLCDFNSSYSVESNDDGNQNEQSLHGPHRESLGCARCMEDVNSAWSVDGFGLRKKWRGASKRPLIYSIAPVNLK